jgi:thioredoxin-related protein
MKSGFIKYTWLILLSLAISSIGLLSFKPAIKKPGFAVNWMSFDDAVRLSKAHPKKIFIDVYTQWCGWCKRMDATTYTDKDIIQYLNDNFYAVRLDAETQDTFHFDNHKFYNHTPDQRGSTNELAFSLLNGQMGYPTTVYLDEKFNRVLIAPNYYPASDLKQILTFIVQEKYKTESFDDYKKSLTIPGTGTQTN